MYEYVFQAGKNDEIQSTAHALEISRSRDLLLYSQYCTLVFWECMRNCHEKSKQFWWKVQQPFQWVARCYPKSIEVHMYAHKTV